MVYNMNHLGLMRKNSILTMALLLLNFALWGVVNNMSDNLVPAFQRIFSMDQDRAVLVRVSFYGAYAVLCGPMKQWEK